MAKRRHPAICSYCKHPFLAWTKGNKYCSQRCHYAGRTSEAHFWNHVHKSDGCWLWTGATSTRGYGKLTYGGSLVAAHRLSYELQHGPITNDLFVCHHCDNPACVRPEHLFLGTYSDNFQDMIRKGRRQWQKGTEKANAKLTEDDVRAIRSRYAAGGVLLRELASDYGIGYTTVHSIIHRRKWAHI